MPKKFKEKELQKATSWTEKVVYIECPLCEHCECVGTEIRWDKDATWFCEKCKKEFVVDDCTS